MKNKYDFSRARKGKQADEVKISKTFRLDADVLEWLEKQGEKEGMGYQTFLNWYLHKAMFSQTSIEERVAGLEKAIYKKQVGER